VVQVRPDVFNAAGQLRLRKKKKNSSNVDSTGPIQPESKPLLLHLSHAGLQSLEIWNVVL
jgi:hypothetical protein